MQHSDSPSPRLKAGRREIFAWAMYDWANSAYSTLSITVLALYIKNVVVAPNSSVAADLSEAAARFGLLIEPKNWGATVWAWGIALSMLCAAVLSPIVGAMADARANKWVWLVVTAGCGATGSVVMAILSPTSAWIFIGLFFVVCLLFELSFGFYNGFLPELATEETMDRISAWGYATGYVGGGLALGLEFLVYQFGHVVGVSEPVTQLRLGLLIMGLWWGFFSLPAIFLLRDRARPLVQEMSMGRQVRNAVGEVRLTLHNIRTYRTLAIFLLGFLFFNDGIQTVISQSAVFAESELQFTQTEILALFLAFQFICLPGAIVIGHVSNHVGQKRTLMVCLAVWVMLLTAAYFVSTKAQFWYLSIGLGLVMGGTQSVSRSIMALMTPERRTAEFFGFFNFSGRATSWIGAFMFGAVMAFSDNARLAILSLLILFLIGWAIAATVNVAQGRRDAAQG